MSNSDKIQEQKTELKALLGENALFSRPRLFLGTIIDATVAPNRAPSFNPYVNDPYNNITAGAGIGLDWSFDLTPIRTKQLKAKLIKEKLLLTSQVEKKQYFDLVALKNNLEARKREIHLL